MDIRYIQEELYPQIFLQAERLLPEFALRRTTKGYVATNGDGFDGARGKAAGKINYLESSPSLLFDNRTGITRNVIKYIQERERLPAYLDALQYCADAVGYALPERHRVSTLHSSQKEQLEEHTELERLKYQALEEVQCLFEDFLWSSSSNRALKYLQARGYTDEDIRAMHAGCAMPFVQVQQRLKERGYSEECIQSLGLQSAIPDKKRSPAGDPSAGELSGDIWHRIGQTYTVSFPIRDAIGRLQGFIVRADVVERDETGKERYPKYLFTKNLSKATPVGFTYRLSDAHVIAVEGIVDALFLQARGFVGVIAVGGKHLTDEQLKTLERYRIRSLTLCFDNDREGQAGMAETIEKIRRKYAAHAHLAQTSEQHGALRQHTLQHIYVCKGEALQTAKDPDEFVRTFGNEAFANVLERDIESAEQFIARRFVGETHEDTNENRNNELSGHALLLPSSPLFSPKKRDEVLERCWRYVRYLPSPVQRQDFLREVSRRTGIDEQVLNEAGEQAQERYRSEQQRQSLLNTLYDAEHRLKKGDNARSILTNLQAYCARADAELTSELPPLAPSYSIEQFLHDIRQSPEGLRTGYAELDKNIRLSQNGVSIIAARPSHGKTSFKMNLLLRLLELYPDRSFCFFSYEEPVKIITLKLLNILAGVRFQGQQLPDLVQYLKHQPADHLHGGLQESVEKSKETKRSNGVAYIEGVERAKRQIGHYFNSKRLFLFGERFSPNAIRQTLMRLQNTVQLGGVFVDYVQKVKPEGKFATRQLELQNVSAELHATAVDMRLPMIVGAQFNREVRTESDIREDCLREAGDLEQDANLVVALWNPAKADNDESPASAVGSADPRRVELKVKTLKNRDGAVDIKGISLLYDMPLSTISSMSA